MKKLCDFLFRKNIALLIVVALLSSSCANTQFWILPETAVKAQAEAELYYINGDFDKALSEYEYIYQTALLPEDRNLALYGIACTQLMLASDDVDFMQAIKHLLRWDANKGSAPFTENRHLLIEALKQQSDLLLEKNSKLIKREKHKNRVIAHQKKKISQMSTTLKSLNKQLEELEAIDETFQDIKKPQ